MQNYIKLLTLIALFILISCKSSSDPSENSKPNFIFLMADDLGFGDVAYNGNPYVLTPVLDQMAASGIQFTRFYSAAPVCTPTRVICLTGRHPARVNMTWAFEGSLPSEEVTIAEALKEFGYTTGHFGKWHVGQLTKTVDQSYSGIPRSEQLYSPPWESTERNAPIGFQAPVMASQAQNTESWSQVSGRQIVWMKENHKIISL